MQGWFSSRYATALYLLVWLMLGVLLAGLVVGVMGVGWGAALLLAVPVTVVYGCAAGFSTYYVCRAYPLGEKNAAAVILVFAFAASIGAGLFTLLCVMWDAMLPHTAVMQSAPVRYSVFGLGVIVYCLLAVLRYLAIESERARQAERSRLESQLAAQEAQLRMLRTQIDPHFLFNSLNSISALTSIDAGRARDMTLQLADFFRHTLGLEAHRKVRLDAEVKLLMHFLAIEKVRFGARLQVEHDIAHDAASCMLPPMILQPLVENAVKHGIGSLPEGGVVRISAQRAGSIVHIVVANDVDADHEAAGGSGIGLVNVRQRLATLYGHQASVNWRRDGTTFTVALALPAETTE